MGTFLAAIDNLPATARWAKVRELIFTQPLPFFEELRRDRPIWPLPELTLVTRFADCSSILRLHDVFGVDLYKPKQGAYFMAQDDTAAHWREKSIMKAILNREDIPAIRSWVGEKTRDALARGAGKVEVVSSISRAVPIALVQEWFGFAGGDPEEMKDWSYWNQQDAFWNQPFDSVVVADQAAIERKREAANVRMAIWLAKLVARKSLAVKLWFPSKDVVSRLLRLSFSNATSFSVKDVILNLGGLLIGAVETTSHAVVNSVEFLLDRKDLRDLAHAAALLPDPSKFDGYIFEALRFRPAFPYYFRTCHRPTPLCVGTAHEAIIEPGTTVLAVTHSAMFDESAFKDPMKFDPERNHGDTFTFGQGLHECLGIAVARVMVPEIGRQMLRKKNLQAASKPDFRGGAVPESWPLTYEPA